MSKITDKNSKSNNSEYMRNKQIEEMAKCCPYHDNGKCHPTNNETVDCDLMCNMFGFMTNLENAGYRKQSEGHWYRHEKKKHGDTCYYCSVCEHMALTDGYCWELTDFCPYCGAKMRGEEK